MFKEKINRDEESLLRDYLGERGDLKERVREAIKAAKEGHGFRIGTTSFINSIIGPNASEVPPDLYGPCKTTIMEVVNEISPRKKSRKGEEKKGFPKWVQDSAQRALWDEERRGGVNPEE